MAAVFDKPSIAQRFVPLFQGFDWPLVLVVAVADNGVIHVIDTVVMPQ